MIVVCRNCENVTDDQPLLCVICHKNSFMRVACPFSLACGMCDCPSPDSLQAAISDGWRSIRYDPDGTSWYFIGTCPECHVEEAEDERRRKAKMEKVK